MMKELRLERRASLRKLLDMMWVGNRLEDIVEKPLARYCIEGPYLGRLILSIDKKRTSQKLNSLGIEWKHLLGWSILKTPPFRSIPQTMESTVERLGKH